MALKVNNTVVIDNSKNIVSGTPSLKGSIINASGKVKVPAGTTAQRPGSPRTGQTFFDTDEGTIVVWNGSEWT